MPEQLTTASGIPVGDNQNALTAGPRGPMLIQDFQFLEKMSHFDRERIPERVVHAKGAGAWGYFECTKDMSAYTKAKFIAQAGKRCELFARFSTVGGEKGSADSARDPRGFAIKFYTEEGNYDMTGNNTPVFFIRDPYKFPDFIHTQKRNPQSNLKDPVAFWDFLSLSPESLHQVTILFSDRGTPRTYRNMNGYTSHTFKFVNAKGEHCWFKLHFKTDAKIDCFTGPEAQAKEGTDPDCATRDLFDWIASGKQATWTVCAQIMTAGQAKTFEFNPFDITKIWPHSQYPLIPFGKMVLNRNPENYFQDVEQSAFSPANLVPGIEASPDKMLQGRLFSYHDTHLHRLGTNYQQIPVNRPRGTSVHHYQRDGFMSVLGNGGSAPNYEPNSFDGPKENHRFRETPISIEEMGVAERYTQKITEKDYIQPGWLFRKVMNEDQRTRLIENIVGHMSQMIPFAPQHEEKIREIQRRQTRHFYQADPEYGTRVAEGLGYEIAAVIGELASVGARG